MTDNSTHQPILAAGVPSPVQLRAELEDLVEKELTGPRGGLDEEVAETRVQDRYLVGMLSPRNRRLRANEMDVLADDESTSGEDGATDDAPLPTDSLSPCSLGLTCTIAGDTQSVLVTGRWGRYKREKSATQVTEKGNPLTVWKRYPMGNVGLPIALVEGDVAPVPLDKSQSEVYLQGRIRKLNGDWVVSLFMVNGQRESETLKDEMWVFQPELEVAGNEGAAVFRKRQLFRDESKADSVQHAEQMALEMLYRAQVEFAVGHGVAVHADIDPEDPTKCVRLRTRAMPTYEVPQTTPPTAEDIPALADVVLDMKALAEMPDGDLFRSLRALPGAYKDWITKESARIDDPQEELEAYRKVAENAMVDCKVACDRISVGIDLLEHDIKAREAFRFANRAMWQQRIHTLVSESKRAGRRVSIDELDQSESRSWRPFQLAFVLLNLPGVTQLDHSERSSAPSAIADLLWFPTGGGKTEAYLGLTAYTLGMRRLQGSVGGRLGHAGVAVIMRYTLRLLTLQQFQRAAALICACEVIRRGSPDVWGTEPFRVGLWVGMKTSPNTVADAHQSTLGGRGAGMGSGTGSPLQLTNCPWCGEGLDLGRDVKVETYAQGRARVFTYCSDRLGQCEFSRAKAPDEGIPVLTVDEEIYRRLPALLIATVDKFAQMPWNGTTQMLFGQVDGYCPRHGFTSPCLEDASSHPTKNGLPAVRAVAHGPLRPPDLIIQDELHLISGPLGSLVGLYETAVDRLCSWSVDGKAVRPKLIASTATIRQATEQVRSLFLRDVRVFPPQGLDVRDNFFSLQREPSERYPGRRYVGVSAFGRRLKVALIRVYSAYLSASQALFLRYGKAADPWMTLLGYFNSMRELGGMRRLVDDDIRSRLRDMESRGLAKRHTPALEELTSRKNSRDIPGLLDRLEFPHDPLLPPHARASSKPTRANPLDVVLATNMISVGVDVKRLGLMVVGGQPKGTAEYIQATSRVGRNAQAPGLVCTVYNWGRPRDLSHYERFEHYHATFYQHVEALSVTPFAARAVDRGVSAVLAALVRLPASEFNENLAAGRLDGSHAIVKDAIKAIALRATSVTQSTAQGQRVEKLLKARIDFWLKKAASKPGGARLGYQGQRDGTTVALLEKTGAGEWEDFTCLGSLRDVEPSVGLIMDDKPLDDGYGQGYSAPAPAAASGANVQPSTAGEQK
ncbi:helicase-like protein [Paraburkholderia sp. BL6669N2]|uniref:DISARM system helicase DrmA n=1 Tax=Paraburkholderia sp. BL6669N2 TaxID=1938807 RepID=UPI000E23162E|nr:DISARM system helicase DrmA [Paraburkholderia sp. BL6669N2]REG59662.1 helicase-like protein [Paraburkholderia sp. BL6669N2]